MRYVLERTVDPEQEPVTLARMKRELGEFADLTDLDDDITAKIVAGREWVEDFTGRALFDQTWRLSLNLGQVVSGDSVSGYTCRPGYSCGTFCWTRIGEIMLRKSPVLAISSLVSVDADGVETTISSDQYALREADSKWPRLVPKSTATWTTNTELRATFRVGYADTTGSPQQDATVIPERFKQAIILYVKSLHDDKPELMKTAEALIRGERVEVGFA